MPPAHGNAPLRWFASNQPASGLPAPVYHLVRCSGEARVAAAAASTVSTASGSASSIMYVIDGDVITVERVDRVAGD